MKQFLSDDFLLETEAARILYFEYAESMPIFDYHCHLPVKEIAENRQFENLTRIWLDGDHYKWRVMRAAGIDEHYITGKAGDYDRFLAWARTVPKTLRNPLYHWTHLELKWTFDIGNLLLSPETADEIYQTCTRKLQTDDFRVQNLIMKAGVKAICTTDDPLDGLHDHLQLREQNLPFKVLPTFRPDKAMAVEVPAGEYERWLKRLEQILGREIKSCDELLEALDERHQYFHEAGCRIADHGLEEPPVSYAGPAEQKRIFVRLRQGHPPSGAESSAFKASLLLELAKMNAKRGWSQQLHIGALRNTNTRMMENLGPDSGFDSISDELLAKPLAVFLDKLEQEGQLARTILYNLNSRDNDMIAAMIGNFQDGSIPGKLQFGPAWWFNDQKFGIEQHLNSLSSLGLLSQFIGMQTDSRSFLSYSRHDYFRRILCNLLGKDMENGELPGDFTFIGNVVKDICFSNARRYFSIEVNE